MTGFLFSSRSFCWSYSFWFLVLNHSNHQYPTKHVACLPSILKYLQTWCKPCKHRPEYVHWTRTKPRFHMLTTKSIHSCYPTVIMVLKRNNICSVFLQPKHSTKNGIKNYCYCEHHSLWHYRRIQDIHFLIVCNFAMLLTLGSKLTMLCFRPEAKGLFAFSLNKSSSRVLGWHLQ